MKAHFRTIIFLALAILLFAMFLGHVNLGNVLAEVRHARFDLLLLALVTTAATYLMRAYRWQYLLRALGPTRFGTAFRTTVIGFAASFLLPARAGEFLRPYLLAREEHLSATSAFATIILERLLDTVTVLVLFAVFLLVFDPGQSPVDPKVFRDVRVGGLTVGIAALVALVTLFVLAGHPDAVARGALRLERVLPAGLAHATSKVVHLFVTGLSAVRQPGRLAMTFILSFSLWLSIALGIFLVTRAFHMPIPFIGSFVVVAILVVGVAVPTPGSVGTFHWAYQIAVTAFYGQPADRAAGAAIVLHAISFLPVTLLGIVFMAREGLSLGRMRGLAKLAGEQKQEETR
jgi:hypothetical protein